MAKILIGYSACQLTREAFEAHGHDVWTCDLLPARGESPKHLQCDILLALAMGWDMAVLHPMCTYLNNASVWALKDPNFEKYPNKGGYHQRLKPGTLFGAERRAAKDRDVENFRHLLDLPFPVAIENPAPSGLNTAIRPPDQVVHPYQFGDDASKGTGFWLTKGLPALAHTKYVGPRYVCGCGATYYKHKRGLYMPGTLDCPKCDGIHRSLPRWGNQTDSGQEKTTPGDNRWLERSKTWPGIAAAAGDQWGRYLNAL